MKGRVEDNVATRRSSGEKGRIIFWLYICSSVFIERLNTQMMVIQKARGKSKPLRKVSQLRPIKGKPLFHLPEETPLPQLNAKSMR